MAAKTFSAALNSGSFVKAFPTDVLNASPFCIEYLLAIASPVLANLLTLIIESIVLNVQSPVQAASAI